MTLSLLPGPDRTDQTGGIVAAKAGKGTAAASDPNRVWRPAWGAALTALVLAPLLPVALRDAGHFALFLGCTAFVLAATVAIRRVAQFHPHRRFGPANVLTMLRLAGASVFLGLAAAPAGLQGKAGWVAAAGAGLLLLSDAVDGWAARRSGLASDFGARFDMEVDAAFTLALSALAFGTGRAGAWVLSLGLLRYAFLALGRLDPAFAQPLPPSRRRRAICGTVVAVLALLLAPPIAPPLSSFIAAVAVGLLGLSFAIDLTWLARRHPPRRPGSRPGSPSGSRSGPHPGPHP